MKYPTRAQLESAVKECRQWNLEAKQCKRCGKKFLPFFSKHKFDFDISELGLARVEKRTATGRGGVYVQHGTSHIIINKIPEKN